MYNESAQIKNDDEKVNEPPKDRELHVHIADTMTDDLHTQRTKLSVTHYARFQASTAV